MKLDKNMRLFLLILSLFFLAGLAIIEGTDKQDTIEGYVISIQPNVSTGYSNLIVMDMAGNEHDFNVPSVKLKDKGIILGDNVRVSIFRDADGNIIDDQIEINEISAETSEGTIKGEVTGVKNSAASGSSELTIKDADGKEHVVNVPLYQGEKLKPGDTVSIKVIGKAEGTIGSVSRTESPKGKTSEEAHSLPGISGLFASFAVLVSAIYRKQV